MSVRADRAFVGADPAQLEALARDMDGAAAALRRIHSTLARRLQRSSWKGPDHDAFVHDWMGVGKRKVELAATRLSDAGTVLRRNATQQRDASSGSGGPGGVRIDWNRMCVLVQWPNGSIGPPLEKWLELAKRLDLVQSVGDAFGTHLGDITKLRILDGPTLGSLKLPWVSGAVALADIGVNASRYGWSDSRSIEAEIDGGLGTAAAALPVRGASLAYSVGKLIGQEAYKGVDALVKTHTGDSIAGNTIRDHYRAAYGVSTPLDADPDTAVRMATATTRRYSGWSGLANAMSDSVDTAVNGTISRVGGVAKGLLR
jgi:hypothetical protein